MLRHKVSYYHDSGQPAQIHSPSSLALSQLPIRADLLAAAFNTCESVSDIRRIVSSGLCSHASHGQVLEHLIFNLILVSLPLEFRRYLHSPPALCTAVLLPRLPLLGWI
jgi:hypothetical protein